MSSRACAPVGDFDTALRMLPKVLPRDVSYGFNFDEEHAWFDTSSDVNLEGYMKRALAQAGWPAGGVATALEPREATVRQVGAISGRVRSTQLRMNH